MSKARTYSRRGMALRRLALLLVLLVGSAALRIGIGSYCVTPEQALRRMESQNGVSDLEVIHTEKSVDTPKGDYLLQICRNGEYMAFVSMRHTADHGWGVHIFNVMEMNDPEDPRFVWECEMGDTGKSWVCLFGFVPEGEEPPAFRVGVFNDGREQEDGSDRLLDAVIYTPVPTIPVEGGKLFLEQHIYSAPHPKEYYGFDFFGVEFDMYDNGEWDMPPNWVSSNV